MLESFPPIADDDSEILVLGSMPGREHPNIKRVIANGAMAAKNVDYIPGVVRAHSTSPACTIPFDVKLEEWRALLMVNK